MSDTENVILKKSLAKKIQIQLLIQNLNDLISSEEFTNK